MTKTELQIRGDGVTTCEAVEEIADGICRMTENSFAFPALTYRTEFEAKLDGDVYEVVRITKPSDFTTRRFGLTTQFTEDDYRVLGEEVMNQGGFWQTDFRTIATVSLPPDSTIDLDEIFRTFNFQPAKIIDDFDA